MALLNDFDLCLTPTDTITAIGSNLATQHDYKMGSVKNWREVHWNFKARILIERVYQRECLEHELARMETDPDMPPDAVARQRELLEVARSCAEQARASYEKGPRYET